MRDIKFRAWFKTKPSWCKQMFYSDDEDFLGDWFNECENAKSDNNMPISCVFMQYTGLNDKHGKPIYEGDIVDWHAEELASGGEDIIKHDYKKCEVFWHPEFAGLMLKTKHGIGSWHFYEDMKIEIIGNIHTENQNGKQENRKEDQKPD